ncbi:hypothetical protein GCM10010969_11660 [Saccharibacillus kuerlensis]|uniref:Uncharacterized protein n=1 Tax=Saccharibacillus kuerlensis TaxID=459527 RepID=A0ABQ2KXE0_9BACL|nr:hypothetical protein GCM10010969_11660 [Saccharibacillus kuerlensis]
MIASFGSMPSKSRFFALSEEAAFTYIKMKKKLKNVRVRFLFGWRNIGFRVKWVHYRLMTI